MFWVFLDIAPCSHVEVDRRFRGAYYLYHQGEGGDFVVWATEVVNKSQIY
jgi:hypothetical protein